MIELEISISCESMHREYSSEILIRLLTFSSKMNLNTNQLREILNHKILELLFRTKYRSSCSVRKLEDLKFMTRAW